jgi:hypothetical protein
MPRILQSFYTAFGSSIITIPYVKILSTNDKLGPILSARKSFLCLVKMPNYTEVVKEKNKEFERGD